MTENDIDEAAISLIGIIKAELSWIIDKKCKKKENSYRKITAVYKAFNIIILYFYPIYFYL